MLAWASQFPNEARTAGTKSDPLSTAEFESALDGATGGELRGLSWGVNPISASFARFLARNPRLTWLSLPDCFPKQAGDVVDAVAGAVGQLGELRELLLGGRPRHPSRANVVDIALAATGLNNLEIVHADLGDAGLARVLDARTRVLALRFPGAVTASGVSALPAARFTVRYPRGLRKVLKAEELVNLKAAFAERQHADATPTGHRRSRSASGCCCLRLRRRPRRRRTRTIRTCRGPARSRRTTTRSPTSSTTAARPNPSRRPRPRRGRRAPSSGPPSPCRRSARATRRS
jgi:hypothetical protein